MLNIQLRTRILNIIKLRLLDALFVRPFSFHHFDFALYFRVTRTCTNIHIGDTRIQVTEHRRSACGDVSVTLPHRTVSPSWCLARPRPWCQWSLGHRLSVRHYSALWTRRLYFIMFVFHVEMWSEETFPSLREWTTEQAEHCALWKDRRTKDLFSSTDISLMWLISVSQ